MTTLVNVLVKRVRLASVSTQTTRTSTQEVSCVCLVMGVLRCVLAVVYCLGVTRRESSEYSK